jgi:RNA 2',3'-cyclic 3'-phosphodiesterase
MLRLFTGIEVPSAVNERLDELVRRLKPLAHIRWSPASNFHITTKFIGAWPQDRLDTMKQALAKLQGSGLFRIAIGGVGFFPNAHRPRIFWAGVEGGEPLATLASRTDEACAKLGVEPEKHAYSPHLTLARINTPSDLAGLHDAIAKEESKPAGESACATFGEFDAGSFHLYLSQPGAHGSIYTSLAEFPL